MAQPALTDLERHGINATELVITKEDRDAHPFTCDRNGTLMEQSGDAGNDTVIVQPSS
jgi:hypothetical protein